MLDFLSEIGSSVPWIYRGWLLLLSSEYRKVLQQRWKSKSKIYKYFDIFLSCLFVILEIVLIYQIYQELN